MRLSIVLVFLGILGFAVFPLTPDKIWAQTDSSQSDPADGDSAEADNDDGPADDSDMDQEAPAFSNPAQAAHAENLAMASVDKTDPEIQGKIAAEAEAKAALDDALATGTQEDIDKAQEAYDNAKADTQAAIAEATGASMAEIAGMRGSGMGWGEIAHALGVHPGVLGLGHTRGNTNHALTSFRGSKGKKGALSGVEIATSRSNQTGLAVGHSKGTIGSSHGKGLALGHSSSGQHGNAYGHGKGLGVGNGLASGPGFGNSSGGQGHGHASGSSGGQGNGHGGGNGGGHGNGHGGGNGGNK